VGSASSSKQTLACPATAPRANTTACGCSPPEAPEAAPGESATMVPPPGRGAGAGRCSRSWKRILAARSAEVVPKCGREDVGPRPVHVVGELGAAWGTVGDAAARAPSRVSVGDALAADPDLPFAGQEPGPSPAAGFVLPPAAVRAPEHRVCQDPEATYRSTPVQDTLLVLSDTGTSRRLQPVTALAPSASAAGSTNERSRRLSTLTQRDRPLGRGSTVPAPQRILPATRNAAPTSRPQRHHQTRCPGPGDPPHLFATQPTPTKLR